MVTTRLKEIDRLAVLKQVLHKKLKQQKAANILGISERHVRNLLNAIKNKGAEGLISQRRGRANNNRKSLELKAKVLALSW